MEKLRATLVVEEINGRRGPFCVGMLQTSIGDFKVTDKELDQFAPGRYSGEFLIEELRTKTVPWRKGTFTYIQALIAEGGFLIDAEDQAQGSETAAQSEPDPIDEEDHATPAPQAPAAVQPRAAKKHAPQSTADATDDASIFGIELHPLFAQRQSPIALDATVERQQFRQQRERLKAAGYRFVSTHQHWVLEGSES